MLQISTILMRNPPDTVRKEFMYVIYKQSYSPATSCFIDPQLRKSVKHIQVLGGETIMCFEAGYCFNIPSDITLYSIDKPKNI